MILFSVLLQHIEGENTVLIQDERMMEMELIQLKLISDKKIHF